MESALITVAYIVAGILFILSLRGLSSQETARQGNVYGMVGMGLAVLATLTNSVIDGYAVLAGTLVVGGAIGAKMAARVAMTAMPELVALLHSFVGAAAVLVGFSTYLDPGDHARNGILLAEIGVDVFIGALTFTGSVVAFLKLKGQLSGKPLLLPGRHALNLGLALACVGLLIWYGQASGTGGLWQLVVVAVLSGVLGVHLVMAIGGADMPVVVSMLNSYSGCTAAAAGFMLGNDLLIVTGALVGSSGAILSYIMCRAMNRSIWNVIFGGFGAEPAKRPEGQDGDPGAPLEVRETTVEELGARLRDAKGVVVVPGYGMAVARAQHAVREFTDILRKQGKTVRFAVHPVAGRLPGHMNVLLAEADVPYDIVLEMDEINGDFSTTDVVLVIGANDVVNPGAQTDEASPIYGMPVLEVWLSGQVVVFKRGRATGYAGIDNPLFYYENTRMLFGDARDSMDQLLGAIRD